jgi:hypothetical protein
MRYLQPGSPYARHTAAITKNNKSSNSGLGSLRITFHTTMLIDSILRAGSPRMNLSAKPCLIQFRYWHMQQSQCRVTG